MGRSYLFATILSIVCLGVFGKGGTGGRAIRRAACLGGRPTDPALIGEGAIVPGTLAHHLLQCAVICVGLCNRPKVLF